MQKPVKKNVTRKPNRPTSELLSNDRQAVGYGSRQLGLREASIGLGGGAQAMRAYGWKKGCPNGQEEEDGLWSVGGVKERGARAGGGGGG